MVEAFVTYLIVGVAAAWILWSVLMPARLRRAIRRKLGGKGDVAATASPRLPDCGVSDCPGCTRPARMAPKTAQASGRSNSATTGA